MSSSEESSGSSSGSDSDSSTGSEGEQVVVAKGDRKARRKARRQARKARNKNLTPEQRQAKRQRRLARKARRAKNKKLTPEQRKAKRQARKAKRQAVIQRRQEARAAKKEKFQAQRNRRKRRRKRAKYGKAHKLHHRAYHHADNVFGCLAGLDIQTVDMKPAAETPHWTYSGRHGPAHWAEMGFSAAAGKEQSPIDLQLTGAQKVDLPKLDIDYEDEDASILNNGHTIQVNWPAGEIEIGDKEYELLQFHFHSPSEHTINGVHYPLEMHMVNKCKADNSLAVLAVLYEAVEGEENAFLAQFWDLLPEEESMEGQPPEDLDEINCDDLDLSEKKYFRYMGSLTTPPCSEGVVWTIMESVEKCSPQQVAHFKECLGCENNRPVQPLNERTVTC